MLNDLTSVVVMPALPTMRVSLKGSTPGWPVFTLRALPSLFRLKSASTLAVNPVAVLSLSVSPTNNRAECTLTGSGVLSGCDTYRS